MLLLPDDFAPSAARYSAVQASGAPLSALLPMLVSRLKSPLTSQDTQIIRILRDSYLAKWRARDHGSEILQHGQLDEIVGAIQTLIPCARLDCVGTSKSDWVRHSQGLNKIVEIYSWDSVSPHVRERFYNHWERRAFWSTMAQRMRVPLETPRGLARIEDDGSFLKSSAFEVPARSRTTWRSLTRTP